MAAGEGGKEEENEEPLYRVMPMVKRVMEIRQELDQMESEGRLTEGTSR